MPNSKIITIRETWEPRLMGGVGAVFQRASSFQCRLLGSWMGLALYAGLKQGRHTAIRNLMLALNVGPGQAQQLARRSYINLGMTFAEFMHQRSAGAAQIRAQVLADNLEFVQQGFAAGHGVIFLTGHIGNWELLGARAALEFPLTVLARPTSNPGVQAQIDAARHAAGLEVISKFENGRSSLRVLKENRALAILPDQHAGKHGLKLPMFGQPTKVIDGVARLALASGALVVPAFGIRRKPWLADGRISDIVRPGWTVPRGADREADVLHGAKRMVAELEQIIREHPDQWLWMHRRWRTRDGAMLPSIA